MGSLDSDSEWNVETNHVLGMRHTEEEAHIQWKGLVDLVSFVGALDSIKTQFLGGKCWAFLVYIRKGEKGNCETFKEIILF